VWALFRRSLAAPCSLRILNGTSLPDSEQCTTCQPCFISTESITYCSAWCNHYRSDVWGCLTWSHNCRTAAYPFQGCSFLAQFYLKNNKIAYIYHCVFGSGHSWFSGFAFSTAGWILIQEGEIILTHRTAGHCDAQWQWSSSTLFSTVRSMKFFIHVDGGDSQPST
jgi:hypothetical protein